MQMLTTGREKIRQMFNGRNGRNLREYVTAYLMITPSVFLIFLFGIFPVGFALFVSIHKWRLKRTDLIGIQNYIKAVDDLTYVMLFGMALGALYGVFVLIRKIQAKASEHNETPWYQVIPGTIFALFAFTLIYWWFMQLPELLDIANKIVGVEKTRELFNQLLSEAFRAESVRPAWIQMGVAFALSIIAGFVSKRLWQSPRIFEYQALFGLAAFSFGTALFLLITTYGAVIEAYTAAIGTDFEPAIWTHVITILSGVILLMIGWNLWSSAEKQATSGGFTLRIFAALVLAVGALLLIMYVPAAGEAGDKDIWLGLRVTVFYSIGTVPFQLTFSLFLAILLFRKMRGSEAFRIIFFLPYVTPTVASAAIFRQLFSSRAQAPGNAILKVFNQEPSQWLRESDGIFEMLAVSMNATIPEWAAGPSLALVVIMMFSIWTYVGYDIVIYLAGLGNIPNDLIESAEIDGAGKWQVFRYITFPLLSPTTYFLSLIAIIGTFKAFGHIFVLSLPESLGTTDTFSVVIFREFFEKTLYGSASAMAFVLFVIIFGLTYVNNKIQGSRVFYG